MSLVHYKKLTDSVITEENSSVEDTRQRFLQDWPQAFEETPCGEGSSKKNTQNIVQALPHIIDGFNIKKINDAGCGDLSWVSKTDLRGANYLGHDIRERREQDKLRFKKLDIINEKMRKADLIICRDVFFHLPNVLVLKAIDNFKKSKSKYLLATSMHTTNVNPPSDWRLCGNKDRGEWTISHDGVRNGSSYFNINLEDDPFNLNEPIVTIPEREQGNRFLGLWRL